MWHFTQEDNWKRESTHKDKSTRKGMNNGHVGGEVQIERKWYSAHEIVAIVITARDSRCVVRGLFSSGGLGNINGEPGCGQKGGDVTKEVTAMKSFYFRSIQRYFTLFKAQRIKCEMQIESTPQGRREELALDFRF